MFTLLPRRKVIYKFARNEKKNRVTNTIVQEKKLFLQYNGFSSDFYFLKESCWVYISMTYNIIDE